MEKLTKKHLTIIQQMYVHVCLYVCYATPRHCILGCQTFRLGCRFNFFKIHPAVTLGLALTNCPQRYANNYMHSVMHLFMILSSYVILIQWKCIAKYCYKYNCWYYITISRVGFPEAINILTGSTKCQVLMDISVKI